MARKPASNLRIRIVRIAAVVLMLIFAACGGPGVGQSASPAASPVSGSPVPGVITWPAVSIDDSTTFSIDISGSGSEVSKVDIHSRFGAVTIGGRTLSALVYKDIPWSSYSLVLYQALAVEAHSWTVLWFYCTGSSLTYIYWESTTSSRVNKEPMKGTCATTGTTQTAVSWPAGSMQAPAVVAGFSVHGAHIDIGNASPGHADFDGKTWSLYSYALVDCSKICGSPGWYELHSLLWDSATGETAYGIVYLITGQTHRVELEYALELPTLGRPANAAFDADWSHS
jgi:hypothetical protein